VLGWVKNFPFLMNRVGMAPVAKSVLNNITSIAYLHCLLRFLSGLVCWFQNSLHVPCRRVSTYTASMTISKTERSRVRNIYWNTVTPAFPLARHTFMGTPFPCNNIYGNGVPMRSRSTTPLRLIRVFVTEFIEQCTWFG